MLKKLFDVRLKPEEFNVAMLIFRLAVGGMMLTHGYPKLMKIMQGNMSFRNPLGIGEELSLMLATMAEFLGSILIILGLGTRIAAFFLGFAMAIAAFIVHFDDPFSRKEKALLFLVSFLVLWITGPGKYSLDHKLNRNK